VRGIKRRRPPERRGAPIAVQPPPQPLAMGYSRCSSGKAGPNAKPWTWMAGVKFSFRIAAMASSEEMYRLDLWLLDFGADGAENDDV
jgi:hypothetical protein